jgi:hypothetical protein
LRALGRIERTLFSLQWLSDPDLCQRSHAGLNKGEASNALRRAVFFHRQGEIRDRTFENKGFRASDLSLITAAIVHWNPFGTIKAWMGATHLLTKTLRQVSTEMSLHVLAYNLKRVMKVLGIVPLMKAMQACMRDGPSCAQISGYLRPQRQVLRPLGKISCRSRQWQRLRLRASSASIRPQHPPQKSGQTPVVGFLHSLGRMRRSCVTGHLLRVRLIERALSLTHCASEARFRLSQCASETGFYCALGRSSLRAATLGRRTLGLHARGAFSRTPAPPPFSGMNSIPAASRARHITFMVARLGCAPPPSNWRTVTTPTWAAVASCCWDHSRSARAARH